MKTLILKTLLAILAAIGLGYHVSAQERLEKTMETFNVEDGVSIDIDGAFTTFVIETWNKDQVQVEAFIETEEELTEEEKQQLLENWDLNVMGNSEQIRISSQGGGMGYPKVFAFSAMPNVQSYSHIGPQINTMLSPMLERLSNIQVVVPSVPPLPPNFFENMGAFKFDYEAYKKDGEKYMKEYEKQIKERFGEDFEKDMEEWGEAFAQKMKERQELMEKRKEQLKERQEKMKERREELKERQEEVKKRAEEMKVRRQEMAERMQEMAERMKERATNNPNASYSKKTTIGPNGEKTVSWSFSNSSSWSSEKGGEKTVIVKIPETAQLDLDIRHGKVELDGKTSNLEANLSHTPFTAEEINGGETEISLSYAPVTIGDWENGSLSLSYIGDCVIENVQNIRLTSNMSDLKIGNIEESGMLRGSFGELTIEKVGSGFETLNIDLQNSELNLQLPNTAFDFDYDGEHSNIDLPESLEVETQQNHGQTYISGYNRSENSSGRISIEADFSEVRIAE
jgi:hypothetical protein